MKDSHFKTLHKRMETMLTEGVCALDVAEALLSIDTAALERESDWPDAKVIGVRQGGRVTGYVTLPIDGKAKVLPINAKQILPETAGLSLVIQVLDGFSCCFIEAFGEVAGIVTREDMEKPPTRMWLFGLLTISEPYCSRKLEELFPAQSWAQHVSPARFQKAKELQSERQRRGMRTSLVDCLQFSDKLGILLRVPEMREDFGMASRQKGKQAAKAIESMRNNLAHNQPIAEANWEAIVLAARRLERILTRI